MSNIVINNLNMDTFLKNIKLTQNYVNRLKTKIIEIKNSFGIISNYDYELQNVAYIICIIQTRTNLVLHITNSQGHLIFSLNSCSVGFSGKAKRKAQSSVVKKFVNVLITSNQLNFLKNKPLALHLKNIGFIKQWVVKELKNFFFMESVKIFTSVSFNGCRQKKLRRKKIKKI